MYYATPKEVEVEADFLQPSPIDFTKIEESLAQQRIPDLKGLPAMEALVLLEEGSKGDLERKRPG